jgi:hypothetical protein
MNVGPQIPHFVAIWRWSKGKRLAALAALATVAEVYVTNGGWLPLSDDIPKRLRVLLIGAVVGLAFYLRWRANRENRNGA